MRRLTLFDHKQLLTRLTERYGIAGKALQWFFSYLDGRTQYISIKDAMSVPVAVDCGVPQGSVIGQINFILFSAPLQDIIAAHGVQFAVYADDTQLYLTFQPQDREAALNKIESCIADIRSWCKSNMLVLNDKKTDMLYFQSHFNRPTCHSLPTITIGNSIIRPSPQARKLGVHHGLIIKNDQSCQQLMQSCLACNKKDWPDPAVP